MEYMKRIYSFQTEEKVRKIMQTEILTYLESLFFQNEISTKIFKQASCLLNYTVICWRITQAAWPIGENIR